MNPVCWYFGHAGWVDEPCRRCGECVGYEDVASGLTRHERLMDKVSRYALRWWLPERCIDCGRRYGRHDRCLPF